jgi:dynactin 1
VGKYIGDVRASKEPFSVLQILSFVREVNQSTSTLRVDGDSVWNSISETLSQLVRETAAFVPLALEAQNVIKGITSLFFQATRLLTVFLVTGTAPWLLRIDDIKSQLAVNAEADRKTIQLNEEIQNLARGIRSKVRITVSKIAINNTPL